MRTITPKRAPDPRAEARRLEQAYLACQQPDLLLKAARAHLTAGDTDMARRLVMDVLETCDERPETVPRWLQRDAREILEEIDKAHAKASPCANIEGRVIAVPAGPRRVIITSDGVPVPCRRPDTALDLLEAIVFADEVVTIGLGSASNGSLEERVAMTAVACKRGDLIAEAGVYALQAVMAELAEAGLRLLCGHGRTSTVARGKTTAVVAIAPSAEIAIEVVIAL